MEKISTPEWKLSPIAIIASSSIKCYQEVIWRRPTVPMPLPMLDAGDRGKVYVEDPDEKTIMSDTACRNSVENRTPNAQSAMLRDII